MKKLLTIALSVLIILCFVACDNEKAEYDDVNGIENIAEPSDGTVPENNVNEEVYYLYEVSKNEKINDLLNNVPELINYGGGYPKLMYGDSYMQEWAQEFCEGFVKLKVKKADSVDTEKLNHTIEFYWGENDDYSIYFTDENIALIDDEAYQILDISYIEDILE